MEAWLVHAVFGVLLIIPWQSVKGIRLLDATVVRDPNARSVFYRSAVASQWILTLLTLAVMWSFDRGQVSALFAGTLNADSMLIIGLASIALMTQSPLIPAIRERMAESKSIHRTLYPIRNVLPRSKDEKQIWVTVALTAGVCEEIIFRGFLFFYAQQMLGLGIVCAIALSSAIFAIGHIYQGTANMIRVGVVAIILGIVYAVSQNLIWCMALHALLDLGALYMDEFVAADETIVDADTDW